MKRDDFKVSTLICGCGIAKLGLLAYAIYLGDPDPKVAELVTADRVRASEEFSIGDRMATLVASGTTCDLCWKPLRMERVWFQQMRDAVAEWSKADSAFREQLRAEWQKGEPSPQEKLLEDKLEELERQEIIGP